MNAAVKHIIENFNLFGFGKEECALLQCVKELFENSLDACRSSVSFTNPVQKSISVHIKSSDGDKCVVEVSDDGCGVRDVISVLKVIFLYS